MKSLWALLIVAIAVVRAGDDVGIKPFVLVPCDGICGFAALKQALENAVDRDVIVLSAGTYALPCDGKVTTVTASNLRIDADSGVVFFPAVADGHVAPVGAAPPLSACAPLDFTATEGTTTFSSFSIGLPFWSLKFASSATFNQANFFSTMKRFYPGSGQRPLLSVSAAGELYFEASMSSVQLELQAPNVGLFGSYYDVMICGCGAGKATRAEHGCVSSTESGLTGNLVCPGLPPNAPLVVLPARVDSCMGSSWVTPLGIGFALGVVANTLRRKASRFLRARMARQNGTNVDMSSPPGYEAVVTHGVDEKAMTEK